MQNRIIRVFYYIAFIASGIFFLFNLLYIKYVIRSGNYDLIKDNLLFGIFVMFYVLNVDKEYYLSSKFLKVFSLLWSILGGILYLVYIYEKYIK